MIEVCELGPLGFRTASGWMAVRGERSAAVVAALDLTGANGIRIDALVDVAWPEIEQPRTARQSLANVIARLRSSLGHDAIVTVGGTYCFGETVVSDRSRFIDEVRAAEQVVDDPARALELTKVALARWRGVPWVDVDRPDLVAGDRALLEDLEGRARRVAAVALAATGAEADAVEALEALLVDGSCDEDLWCALASATNECGRRADALVVIDRARRALGERGVDPGRSLLAIERQLRAEEKPLAVRRPRFGSLPRRPTCVLGRDPLLEATAASVSQRRATTLVGPGGVGKTTLAVEVACRRAESEQVAFVDLAPVRDGRRCEAALATAVGVEPATGVSMVDAIVEHLRNEEVLLVIDNCEHVRNHARNLVAVVIEACPSVDVLATSREPLGVDSERVLLVEPLSVKGDGSAVDLFFARADDSGVRLDVADWSTAVADICNHLDGLPLAIELAARRTIAMSPDEILASLDERLSLLRVPNADGRQSSLRETIGWSWELLSADEQRAMSHLAVFGSGSDLDTVAAVLGIEDFEAIDLVQALASKSLVTVVRRVGRPSRAVLLESVRAFVLDATDAAVLDNARRAHVDWIAWFVDRTFAPDVDGRYPRDPLGLIDSEVHEVRIALEYARSHRDHATTGVALAAQLRDWFRGRDAADEGVEWLSNLLAIGAVAPAAEVAGRAALATLMRLVGASEREVEDVLAAGWLLLDDVADPAMRNHLELRVVEAAYSNDDESTPVRLRRLATAARAAGTNEDGMALHLLTAWMLANDPEGAAAVAAETTEASIRGTIACQAHAAELTALSSLAVGDPAPAGRQLLDALDRFDETEQRMCSIHCCESVAWWLAATDATDDARRLLTATEGVRRRHGRFRAGFEAPAVAGVVGIVGTLPSGDVSADADATIALARVLLTDALAASSPRR